MLSRYLVITLLVLCQSAPLYAVNEGDEIENGGVPHSVAIVYRSPKGTRTVCGGLLFAGGCVLTAAHCIKPPGSVYEIYQGTTIDPENLLTIGVDSAARSENPNDWPEKDVALIKLHGALPDAMSVPIKNLYTKKIRKGTELHIAGPGQNRSYIDENNEVVETDEFGDSHQGTVTVDAYENNHTKWGWRNPNGTVLFTKRGKKGQISAPGDSGSVVRFQRKIKILPGLELNFPEKVAGVTSIVIYDSHDGDKPRQPEDIEVAAFASFVDKGNVEWVKKAAKELDCEHNTQSWAKRNIQKVITANIKLDLIKKRRKLDEEDMPSAQFKRMRPETKKYLAENIRKLANVPADAPVKIGAPIRLSDSHGLYFPVDIALGDETVRFHMDVPFPTLMGTKPIDFEEDKSRPQQATR